MRDYFFLAIMWFNWYLVTLLVVLVQKTNKVISDWMVSSRSISVPTRG